MRKKLQEKMFELSYLFELMISLIVGIAIVILGIRLFAEMIGTSISGQGENILVNILDNAITLAIGVEFIKMLCKHTPETVIEVLAFALARQLIVFHTTPLENLITVAAIAILFAVRKFFLRRGDVIENPDGFLEIGKRTKKAEKNDEKEANKDA